MTKEKFTPEPWYKRNQGSEIEIKSGIYTICMVHNFSGSHEVNTANADLILTAPKMYKALKEMLKCFKPEATWQVQKDAVLQAEIVLKQAAPQLNPNA